LGLISGKPLFTKYTSIIDLTKTEDELMKGFHPKTRYNIRLAEKHGVTVREDNSPEAFEQYLKLLLETTHRQGFYAHNEKYHRLQWQILQPAGISHLLVAKYQGKILAAFLLFLFNNKLYYPYGASTRENKELMAPNLLMWEAIKFGKKNNAIEFDLWGETNPNTKESDPWYGFHHFKMGYSPKIIEFIGTYDLVINPALYKIYNLADKLLWKILRLKAKVNR
jgi:lipid II:glycine glycyltransferase (peptidoglycan interpeptide bridge formation enzyme)